MHAYITWERQREHTESGACGGTNYLQGKQIVFLKEPESDRGSTRRARRRAGAPREQAMLPAAPAGIAFTGRERGHVSKKSKKKRETVNYKREK